MTIARARHFDGSSDCYIRLSALNETFWNPADVVELRAGDLVPADGIVLRSRGALANEAILTGEPYPTEKRCGPCDATSPVDAFNALFSGTSLVGGEAVMLVVATGGATRFGAIVASLQDKVAPTAACVVVSTMQSCLKFRRLPTG